MQLEPIFQSIHKAASHIVMLEDSTINKILLEVADEAEKQCNYLLLENSKDLERMDASDPKYDRLQLTSERIKGIAADIRNVASLSSPLNKVLHTQIRPNGLQIHKVSVALGVVGVIYEARPNVTFDVFALCLKSGNACVLKGGTDADSSNRAIVALIHTVLQRNQINKDILVLLPPDREATAQMLKAVQYIDVVIPRGSQQLINFVRENSRIPVIETGAGIVHTYFDEFGDLLKGAAIINNAKTRRVSVCNALDCLIIHQNRLKDLVALVSPMASSNVEIFADESAYLILTGSYPPDLLHPATAESFGTEFLSYKMSIKTVANIDEAIDHIYKYSSKHSEAIISEDKKRIDIFMKRVDASSVYANTSTAFTDGAQFGLGAEIGISTQKLHARGPMALEELTSYKWLVYGDGQIRK